MYKYYYFVKSLNTCVLFICSFMGKGLIQASPQTVLETVKNPRTKFTYDDTLKVCNL